MSTRERNVLITTLLNLYFLLNELLRKYLSKRSNNFYIYFQRCLYVSLEFYFLSKSKLRPIKLTNYCFSKQSYIGPVPYLTKIIEF